LEKAPKLLSAARRTNKHSVAICSLQIQAFKQQPRRPVFQTTEEICFHGLNRPSVATSASHSARISPSIRQDLRRCGDLFTHGSQVLLAQALNERLDRTNANA
jgi:hypothetical protein